MNRRSFLSGFLAATYPLAGASWTMLPRSLSHARPDDGAIQYRMAAQFGPDHDILEIRSTPDCVVIRIGFRGRTFLLESTDGDRWHPVAD